MQWCNYVDQPSTHRPLIWEILNGDITATGHPVHWQVLFWGRIFGLEQIQDNGHEIGARLVLEWTVAYPQY